MPGVEIQLEEGLNSGSSKFDLNIIAISRDRHPTGMYSVMEEAVPTDSHSNRSILLIWEYNSDLFEIATMERMLGHFRTILVSATENPCQKLSELKLMSVEEEKWLRTTGKGKETLYPRDACIHEVFSKQAMQTPEMVALKFLGQEMSYRELDERSNQLARHLKNCGVGLDAHVGICLERSFEMIIGIIGILKAGGAYVPLDHSYPKERIDFIRNDTRAAVVVTCTELAEKFAFPLEHTIYLAAPLKALDHESTTFIKPSASPENLAYILYTSGSTGLPKGVRVVHRGVVRLVKETDYVDLNPDHRFWQYAPISFDAATFEIFGALLNGATLVIAPPRLVSFIEFGRFTKNENITTVWLTSPLFHQMVDHALPSFANIQQLLVGGDVLSPNHVARFVRQYPDICLINGYGPTEGTTFTCCHKMKGSYPSGKTIPIGKPIANTQVYILDGHGRPVPIGVKGELYIGGDGLARDYFERPDLTTMRFVADTVSGKHNKRLYRTGDWGRFLADGTIEFLGRTDHQVKIRGFRVEPGEIESELRRHHDIGDAVVTVDDSSPEYCRLIAYVVPAGDALPEEKHIQNFLRERCPPHMIPYRCLITPTLPLTSSGKINRSALPKPDPITPKKITQLQSVDEWRMSEIWSDLLGVQIVDAQDNFFDQGGHSLLGLQLVSRIGKTFGVECPLSILFEAPTVLGLVKWLQRTQSKLSTKSRQPRYDSHVKCLQRGNGKLPLFWVPGGWGSESELVVYARIMRHMGDDLPFYGFLAHGIDGITPPITQVKSMAAAYICEMKKIQSSGPYYLAGECRGGIVAYEMARQLRDSGDTVAFLALVDTAFPHRMAFIKNLCMQLYRRMRKGIHDIRYHSNGQRLHCALLELADIQQFIGDEIGWVPYDSNPENEKARIKFRYRVGQTIYRQTLQRYQPKPYAGNVMLILSSQTHQSAHLWKDWLDCVQGEVEIKIMPGDHVSYIRDHAEEMGKVLRNLLEYQWQLQ